MRELYSKSQVKSMTWSCCIWSNRSIYYNKQSYLYQGPTSVWTIAEECESLSLLFSSFTYLRHYRWQGRMLHTSPPSSDFFPLHLTSRRFLVGFLHGVGVTTPAAANLFTSNFIYVIYVFISFCVNRVHHAGGWDASTTHIFSSVMGFLPKVFDYLFNDMGGVAAVVAHNQSVNALFWDSYHGANRLSISLTISANCRCHQFDSFLRWEAMSLTGPDRWNGYTWHWSE